jgi:hypothetical protein
MDGHVQDRHVLNLIQDSPEFTPYFTALAPYGFYKGRFIIGECTRINGGIYLSAQPYEELVIDESHGALGPLLSELVTRFNKAGLKGSSMNEYQIISETLFFVRSKLLYRENARSLIKSLAGVSADQKVSLDVYVRAGLGAARHQVLLAAYLFEKLKSAGILTGCLYIDSSGSSSGLNTERLAYTSASGEFICFNPAARQREALIEQNGQMAVNE